MLARRRKGLRDNTHLQGLVMAASDLKVTMHCLCGARCAKLNYHWMKPLGCSTALGSPAALQDGQASEDTDSFMSWWTAGAKMFSLKDLPGAAGGSEQCAGTTRLPATAWSAQHVGCVPSCAAAAAGASD